MFTALALVYEGALGRETEGFDASEDDVIPRLLLAESPPKEKLGLEPPEKDDRPDERPPAPIVFDVGTGAPP